MPLISLSMSSLQPGGDGSECPDTEMRMYDFFILNLPKMKP